MENNNDILNNINLDLNKNEDGSQNLDILNWFEKSLEIQNNFLETNEEKNSDLFDFVQEIQNEVEIEKVQETQELTQIKQENKLLSWISFWFKYILTSSLIFGWLLVTTNYSAYLEIAKSYFSPEALETTKNSMYASINSASIVKNEWELELSEEKEIQNQIQLEQKIDIVKNKTYHSMEKIVWFNEEIPLNIEITPYENRIVIPKIWKNIPLIDVEQKNVKDVKELEEVFMQQLVNWIVRYPWSAKPWDVWNSFIFWHSSNFPWLEWKYNDVFALLDKVEYNDEIIVYYNQKKYTYKIKTKKVVRPWNTNVLKWDEWKKEISIMTCWPVWTTLNRLIVMWELENVTNSESINTSSWSLQNESLALNNK